jgi:monoamine oxidase
MTRRADALGLAYLKRVSFQNRNLHLGAHWADATERAACDAAMDMAFAASDELGAAGRDVAVKEAFDVDGRWYRLVEHLSEAISGLPPEEISTVDYYHYSDTEENWPVIGGYGALVAACGAGVPVSLETPVSAVDHSGDGVVLTTPKGKVAAKAAIITVSTNVLASGRIAFNPGLPVGLERALAAVPTGFANKVAVQFSRDVFGMEDTSYAYFMDERDKARHGMSFQIRPFGQELAIAYLGGRHAVEMEAAGEGPSFEMVRDALCAMFGSDIVKSVSKMAATGWGLDPHTLGAYSCALPGGADQRAVLSEPINERLYLAGEAVHPNWFSTVHGAWESGERAAARAMAAL